jgi:hypothetical protein
LKLLDHTDSGSAAGSEKFGGTQATVTARTTASHNIATSIKPGNLKNKGNLRRETAPDSAESDEDDSREREAALSSPIIGKVSRELSKASYLISLVIALINN